MQGGGQPNGTAASRKRGKLVPKAGQRVRGCELGSRNAGAVDDLDVRAGALDLAIAGPVGRAQDREATPRRDVYCDRAGRQQQRKRSQTRGRDTVSVVGVMAGVKAGVMTAWMTETTNSIT